MLCVKAFSAKANLCELATKAHYLSPRALTIARPCCPSTQRDAPGVLCESGEITYNTVKPQCSMSGMVPALYMRQKTIKTLLTVHRGPRDKSPCFNEAISIWIDFFPHT